MIDFKEEISKYKPILNMDEVEASVKSDEVKDIMDLLQYITSQIAPTPAAQAAAKTVSQAASQKDGPIYSAENNDQAEGRLLPEGKSRFDR